METLTFERLVYVLQISVSPVVLVSGVGLLLLSMTNRLGRVVDRARTLHSESEGQSLSDKERALLVVQIRILYRRCRILTAAIGFSTLCIFLVGLLILSLFATSATHEANDLVGPLLFLGSIASLLASLGFFLGDIALTLRALRLEISEHLG